MQRVAATYNPENQHACYLDLSQSFGTGFSSGQQEIIKNILVIDHLVEELQELFNQYV
jgi:hypothetical protein